MLTDRQTDGQTDIINPEAKISLQSDQKEREGHRHSLKMSMWNNGQETNSNSH